MTTHAAGLTTETLLAEAQWVRGLALHLTRDPDRADDVAQETLLRAITRPPAQAPAPRAWLATVAANLVRSAGRQERRRRSQPLTGEEPAGPEASGTPEQLLERMQLQRLLADLLLALDEPYREVVLLRYIEGLSSADIAARLNVAAGTIRWRLKVGLDSLRRELDRAHGGERERWRRVLIPFAALASEGFREPTPPAPARVGLPAIAAMAVPALALLLALIGWGLVRRAQSPAHEQAARPAAIRGARVPGQVGAPAAPGAMGGLAGRVTDGTGRGVPGAVVTAVLQNTRPRWAAHPFPDESIPSAVADADGRYRLLGLTPGSYGVAAHAPGRGQAAHGPLAVGADEPITVDLRLQRPGAVARGRVLDQSGGPVPGARVLAIAAEEAEGEFLVQTRSDDHGRFQLELGASENHLRADAPGYAPEVRPVDLDGLAEVAVDLQLLPAGRLTGTITTQGQPLEAAEVLVDLADGALVDPVRAVTDAAGRFWAEGLAPGRYRVTARKQALVTATPALVEVTGGQLRELGELPVAPGTVLRGRVVRPEGGGLPDAYVSLLEQVPGSTMDRQVANVRTDGDGGFRLEGLPPGRYSLEMSAQSWTYQQRWIEIPATGTSTVELQARRAARVGGIVVGADGAAIAGARLIARVLPRDQTTALADRRQSGPDGRFTLHNLAPGVLQVVAMHGDQIGQTGPLEVTAEGDTRLTLRLSPAAQVSGVVRYSDGKPAAALRVAAQSWVGLSPSPPAVRTDSEGRFTIGPFLPGDATISLLPPGITLRGRERQRPELRVRDLRGGEHRRGVDFTLPVADGELAGRLLGPGGEPQVGLVVGAGVVQDPEEGWQEAHRTVTNGDGMFLLQGLPEASYVLRASHPDWPAATLSGLKPGRKDIELRFAPGAVLSGEVRDISGRTPGDFQVILAAHESRGEPPATLVDELARVRLQVRDGSGRFVLPRLPAGLIDVHVVTSDGRTGRAEAIALAAGKQARARIALGPTLTVRGRVVKGESGEPAVGWELRVFSRRESFKAVTDAAGRFVLPGLFGAPQFHVQVGPREGGMGDGVVVYRDRGTDQDVGTLRVVAGEPGGSLPGVVGLELERRPEGLVVVRAVPQLPAARAGVTAGDRLLAVDGRDVGDLGHFSARQVLRGQPGSVARLSFERAGQPPFELSLTRVQAPGP